MDFLITGFIYWIFNLICPREEYVEYGKNQPNEAQSHYENGAAFFFSSSHLGNEDKQDYAPPPINEDYNCDSPEW